MTDFLHFNGHSVNHMTNDHMINHHHIIGNDLHHNPHSSFPPPFQGDDLPFMHHGGLGTIHHYHDTGSMHTLPDTSNLSTASSMHGGEHMHGPIGLPDPSKYPNWVHNHPHTNVDRHPVIGSNNIGGKIIHGIDGRPLIGSKETTLVQSTIPHDIIFTNYSSTLDCHGSGTITVSSGGVSGSVGVGCTW